MSEPERTRIPEAQTQAPTIEGTLTPQMLPPLALGDATVLERMRGAQRSATTPSSIDKINTSLQALAFEVDTVVADFLLINPRDPGIADTVDKQAAGLARVAHLVDAFGAAFKATPANPDGPAFALIQTSVMGVERALANLLFEMRVAYKAAQKDLPVTIHDKFRDAFAGARIALRIEEARPDGNHKAQGDPVSVALGMHFDAAVDNLKLIVGGTGAGQQLNEWSAGARQSEIEIAALIDALPKAARTAYKKRAGDLEKQARAAQANLKQFSVPGADLETIATRIVASI